MGKKKKQEKQKEKEKQKDKRKKNLSPEEKKLLKARKKEEKAAKSADETVTAEAIIRKEDSVDTFEKETSLLTAQNATVVFRALGDEVRMEILGILQEEELCAMELLERVRVVQSTLSHHMKVLTEAGLVCCRKDYKRIYYTVNGARMKETAAFLQCYEKKAGN